MSQPVDLDALRASARLAGFEWTDAELEAIRPMVEASLRLLAGLEELPLDEVEPTTQYRIF
jgi:Asp-tRNA(Asn)/Glu-tRNA(Gln) amidotransferase C subunit